MSSSVGVLETKAARVSLARPVHSCPHNFLETPVTQAKCGSSFVQVSFDNCPQPRSVSNSPAFLACLFCFPIADHVMLPQKTIYFFQMPRLVILSVVSGMILFRREEFSTKEARYCSYINKLIY